MHLAAPACTWHNSLDALLLPFKPARKMICFGCLLDSEMPFQLGNIVYSYLIPAPATQLK